MWQTRYAGPVRTAHISVPLTGDRANSISNSRTTKSTFSTSVSQSSHCLPGATCKPSSCYQNVSHSWQRNNQSLLFLFFNGDMTDRYWTWLLVPKLAQCARWVLSVPATSTSSERVGHSMTVGPSWNQRLSMDCCSYMDSLALHNVLVTTVTSDTV